MKVRPALAKEAGAASGARPAVPSLAAFQQGFAQALLADPQADAALPPAWARLVRQPAFAIYRNTVLKACIDALEANFPAVSRLVGRDWFRSAAAAFVRAHPPHDGRLLCYGDRFADYLGGLESAAGLPYLRDVARLDRFWSAVHAAADAPVLNAAELARLTPEALGACRLAPHPAARWDWFADTPAFSIWHFNRSNDAGVAADGLARLAWHGEGVLITRAADAVCWQPASAAQCAFLDACRHGQPLGRAAQAALGADDRTDLAQLLSSLLRAGAFRSPANHCKESTP